MKVIHLITVNSHKYPLILCDINILFTFSISITFKHFVADFSYKYLFTFKLNTCFFLLFRSLFHSFFFVASFEINLGHISNK
ncbi:hypothetical protein C1645_769825 [Glomus cerebriforme]|uniref:Uncharacterized protein n=1 Tax=Glomus cerebriforme TaxID=658196 RepID=A0A397SZJ6_9GLOM|nr:hypothetical protein C1645_769825 [Glomus cerebriforme]